MKYHRKSSIALAVSAVLGGAFAAPSAFGFSIDISGNPNSAAGVLGTYSSPANPPAMGSYDPAGNLAGLPLPALAPDSGGDTLLFPIYTTAEGASTSFSTTNTGNSTIAAKIRFREQEHSMDVLDFIVVYSPQDKFDFYVTQGAERPQMNWNDTSCVVGPQQGGVQAFPPPSQFVESDEVMSVGHVEILGMANLDAICWNTANDTARVTAGTTCVAGANEVNLGDAGTHDPATGEPENCALLTEVLSNPRYVAQINLAAGINVSATGLPTGLVANPAVGRPVGSPIAYDVPNDLIGRYLITDVDGGIEAGGDAIAIAGSNFTLSAQSGVPCAENNSGNGVNCRSGYAWDNNEWDHPHFGDMPFLAAFQDGLTARSVSGDWSVNTANAVGFDWIVSFPSKYAYLDKAGADWELLNGTRPNDRNPIQGLPNTVIGRDDVWTGGSGPTTDLCVSNNRLAFYDYEENRSSSNVTVSPGDVPQFDLCHELGVYTVSPAGVTVRDSVIQTTERREIINFQNLDSVRGWGKVEINFPGQAGAINPISGMYSTGGAVNALNLTVRATADPAFNNGSLTTLQKDQQY